MSARGKQFDRARRERRPPTGEPHAEPSLAGSGAEARIIDSAPGRSSSLPGSPAVTSANAAQLQRTLGNQGVQQLVQAQCARDDDSLGVTSANAAYLQRTIGNFAVQRLIQARRGQDSPPAPADVAVRIQRHPHALKDNKLDNPQLTNPHKAVHSNKDGENAVAEAKRLYEATDARFTSVVQSPASGAKDVEAVKHEFEEAQKDITVQWLIAQATSYKQQAKTWKDRIDSRVGTVGSTIADKAKEARKKDAELLKSQVPTYLLRAERDTGRVVDATKDAVAAPTYKDADRAASLAERLASDVENLYYNIEGIAEKVKEFLDLQTYVNAHKNAAAAAKNAAEDLAPRARAYANALKLAEAKTAELAKLKATIDKLRQPVKAAEKGLKVAEDDLKVAEDKRQLAEDGLQLAREDLQHTQGFVASLLETLDEIEGHPDAHLENIGLMRQDAAARVLAATAARGLAEQKLIDAQRAVSDAHQAVADAQKSLAAEQKALSDTEEKVPAAEEAEKNAKAAVPGLVAPANAAADTATENLDLAQSLRGMAGDEAKVSELVAKIPDKKMLEECLTALGYDTLDQWLRDGRIGSARITALVTTFGAGDLKAFIGAIGLTDARDLAGTFPAAELHVLADDAHVGAATLKTWLSAFSATDVKTYRDELTLPGFKQLLTDFTPAELKSMGLTSGNLKDLLTTFTSAELKTRFTDFGKDALKDFLTKFTAAELKQYETDCGYARLKVLANDKKLKADALHKYTAAWLKVFVGAGGTSTNHILQVYTRNDTGVISGGHDPGVFQGELDLIIRPAHGPTPAFPGGRPAQRNGHIIATPVNNPNFRKVTYQTFTQNGVIRTTGSKTLMIGLAGGAAAWERRANEAIWGAIKNLTFEPDNDQWSGQSADGINMDGFYTKPEAQVRSYWPTA